VLPDRTGSKVLDYLVPAELAASVQVGSRVRVPVRTRTELGTVVRLMEDSDLQRLRPIEAVIGTKPVLPASLLRLAEWMADYYCCPLETAIASVLPQVIRRAEVGHKRRLVARLARDLSPQEIADLQRKAPRQASIIDILGTEKKPVPLAELLERAVASRAAAESLAAKGVITIAGEDVQRDPFGDEVFLPESKLVLNEEQRIVLDRVLATIADPARGPVLLHGVTGSGKTEIYLQAMEHVLGIEKTAIMLVPEIALTPQTVERFKSRFASGQREVAVLHSHLSEGERHDEWHKIHDGRARIVIGARSAVFAPLENVGLIVVDEEHETSYKQEDAPRYQSRDLAVVRGRLENAAVLLGSATPSIESYHNAATGKYQLCELRNRIDGKSMPRIRIIDMRQRKSAEKASPILSEPLVQAISERLSRREQSILFLNRRGFSTSLICARCGFVCECPNCSVAVTFHRNAQRIICHVCGHAAVAPVRCPECADPGIRYSGTGTEKVEEAVGKIFPQARTRRLDADSVTRRGALRDALAEFRAGKIDILVGTQMIAKGLHFPNVTLVGIINADLALHLPDFRAGERTFQLLTQVAGRAGRGEVEGEVFVQTFTPFSPSIQFARHHDWSGFWEQEIDFRERWNYPPFTHMTLITVRSPHEVKARFSAETLAKQIAEGVPRGTTISEVAPAPLERSHGNYRFHLMLRTRTPARLSRHLRAVMDKLPLPEEVIATVDMDAYQLL
jgi:primosomal protein N' (replication factor Y)